jgi:hypothetical protein
VNAKRIIYGGLIAGSIIVLGEIVRHVIFPTAAPAGDGAMPWSVFVLRGASLGIFCLLLYAGLRPALGAGVKTAVTVGILVFLVGTLFPPFGVAMQSFTPARALLTAIVWNAVMLPLATVAGAWLYRDAAHESDAAQLVLGDPINPLR